MIGSSILPTTIFNNQIYMLFGKERNNDKQPGWSDFGGGNEKNETLIQTASREGAEELNGFIGDQHTIQYLLHKYGIFFIHYCNTNKNYSYRIHILPMHFNYYLVPYFNNNQNIIHSKISKQLLKKLKIFEKTQIKWFNINSLIKHKHIFRKFYQPIIQTILSYKNIIYNFVYHSLYHIQDTTITLYRTKINMNNLFQGKDTKKNKNYIKKIKKSKKNRPHRRHSPPETPLLP